MLVFAYSNSVDISVARLEGLRKAIDKRLTNAPAHGSALAIPPPIENHGQQSEPETPAKTEQQLEKENHSRLMERHEIELAKHIVNNAIWLNKNGFSKRFQAALPDAMAELEKLAKHKEWWARLYVVYIMRQNPMLLQSRIMGQLAEDENELVSEAAKSISGK